MRRNENNGMSERMPTRPILRYFGGKWMLAPWIIKHFPAHRIYVEPFGGAASVLMRKPRAYSEVYNDLDGEIVNVFRVLQDAGTRTQLEQLVRLTPFARREFELSYEPADDPVEHARRKIFRSMAGFGSDALQATWTTGFRGNAQRSGTMPAHNWATYPEQLRAFGARLAGVVIECVEAERLIEMHDTPETLFYCDPPYVWHTRANRRDWRRDDTNILGS